MTHPAPARHLISNGALWLGLFGGPVLWALQLMVGYGLTAHGCFPGTSPRSGPIGAMWSGSVIATLIAVIGTCTAGFVALKAWRSASHERAARDSAHHTSLLDIGEGRTRFMAFAGILSSGVFLLAELFSGWGLAMLRGCFG